MKTFSPKTIAGKKIAEMEAQGYEYKGYTTGWTTFRKGSNLSHKLEQLGLTEAEVEIRNGAKLQHATEGSQILIFVKAA